MDYALTPAGRRWLDEMDVVVPARKRTLIRYCVDWSEQRHHLAGLLGRSILDRFLSAGWVRPRDHGRSVRVTPSGEAVLAESLDIEWGKP